MRIIVPFAGPSWPIHAVKLALKQDGWEPELHHMREDGSYFDLFSRLWAGRETFVTVEHDIVVWPGGIQALIDCDGDWCTLPYYCSVGWIVDGLGCTKFSDKLMRQYPTLLEEPFPQCCSHTRHYCGLDRLIGHRMQELGLKPCVHSPGVVNLNEKWT